MSTVISTDMVTEDRGAIAMCQKEDLDAFNPSWGTDTQSDSVENFAFDERNPTQFYVYPPAGEYAFVEVVYVKEPTDCASTSSSLGVADQYQTALRYLTLSIAYEKDIEGANPERAEYYRQAALATLAASRDLEVQGTPNANNQDGKIARTGGK